MTMPPQKESRTPLTRRAAHVGCLAIAWSVFGLAGAGARDVFVLTGGLHEWRSGHAAVRLADGRVLLAGGWGFDAGYSFALGSAEVYEPAAGAFARTGAMRQARIAPAAVRLDDGRVLVLGGWGPVPRGGYDSLASAELYDPSTGAFTPTGDLGVARQAMTATVLPDGKVLVTGGYSGFAGAVASAEIYDPATGTFSPAGNLTRARGGHVAVSLANGQVLLAGEHTAELYDPATRTFSATGEMTEYRSGPAAARLDDGRVLVAGGPKITAEFYDPDVGRFSSIAILLGGEWGGAPVTRLATGAVLFVGGTPADARWTQRYEPGSNTFVGAAALRHVRSGHTATLLADGTVLVAGGGRSYPDPPLAAEIYHASGYTDLTPPTITVPSDITVVAHDAAGTLVAYEASASDEADSFLTVACSPESATVFPIGATHVRCTSTDSSGNAAEASFAVTVVPPLEISVVLPRRQAVAPQTGVALLAGTVLCNRNVEVGVSLELTQPQATGGMLQAFSHVSVSCLAPWSSWTSGATPIGGLFAPGEALVRTSAVACDVDCDVEQRTRPVRLRVRREGRRLP